MIRSGYTVFVYICVFLFLTISGFAEDGGANKGVSDDFDADFDKKPGLEVSMEVLQKFGVKTVPLVKKVVSKDLRVPGVVSFDETTMHTINTKYAGWVEKLYIDYEGKYVKKGAVVAEIYSPKLLAAKEELLILYNMEKKKTGIYSGMFNKDREKLISGAKERLKNWDISEHEINQLIKDGAATRTVSVYSPHEGYVVEKMITAGSSISPGKPLFRIASLSKVWIIVDVYEQDVPYIKLGQSAEIYLANFPGKVFKSKVDYIYPELSGKTRTLKVRFPVDNPDGALKPGMYMEINTSFNIGEQLLVPTEAVIDDGVRKIVFTEEEEKGIFYPKEVALGLKTNGYYVVLGGLTEGEKVVQGANFLLDSDARLKGIKPLEKN